MNLSSGLRIMLIKSGLGAPNLKKGIQNVLFLTLTMDIHPTFIISTYSFHRIGNSLILF